MTETTGTTPTRIAAARVLGQVVGAGQSLNTVLPAALARVAVRERGLLQELCYGTLRWYPQLQYLLERLLRKPLDPCEHEVHALLLMGLYQLLHLRVPAYATVSEAVTAARGLGKSRTTGLINAVLRNFQRRRHTWLAELERDACGHNAHPAWLLHRLQDDWPEHWQALVAANNARPPYTLRVNLARLSRQAYLESLAAAGLEARPTPFSAAGITLAEACEVALLPGFREGWVAVQDAAAQLAAGLLDLRPGLRVLDACAAPGGKTCHILETEPHLSLLALDSDAGRLRQVQANLQRLGLAAATRTGAAEAPAGWWDGLTYDRNLLDAPCSGTGVIRRHPDIKVLRRADDIDSLAVRQRTLLEALWPLLKPGGKLVYATCSVLQQENERNVAGFIAAHPDTREHPIPAAWGQARLPGRQILSGESGMDGFYYACLSKG
jgi:16S rRNA (cytosine967-C5)-methyltransferase